MPPEAMVQMRVEFYYRVLSETTGEYWNRVGRELHEYCEKFHGQEEGDGASGAQSNQPADSDKVTLHKIYGRVQQVRNLSFERSKTKEEEKRDKLERDNKHVQDVWERGHGYGAD